MNDPSILIVVPARGGSKRLPGKNLAKVGGKSLIARVAEFLKGEGRLGEAVMSTDDEAIAEAGRAAGLHVPFMRPEELASDTATSADVTRHALAWREKTFEPVAYVALIQVTTPFRRRGLLNDALAQLQARPSTASVIAMTRIGVPPAFVFAQSPSGEAVPCGAGAGAVWVPTGSLYLVRRDSFLREGSFYAPPILISEVSDREAIDIDTAYDLEVACSAAGRAP